MCSRAVENSNGIDKFDEFDQQRIERFIKAYRGIDHHVGGQG
jgi:hypothetical protein